jgi:triacylglycerol lipase
LVSGGIAVVDYALALSCAQLCKEIYGDFTGLRFSEFTEVAPILIESNDQGITDTQVAILEIPTSDQLFIVFRGSDKSIDWINNVQFRQQIYPYGDGNAAVKFHRGFMAAYFAIRDRLLQAVDPFQGKSIVVTGHSLGGAVATIAALDMQYNLGQSNDLSFSLYTFGSPRVGNEAQVASFNRRVSDSHRFINGWDIVTRVPREWQGYAHVDLAHALGSRWTWQVMSRRFSDHAIDRYIEGLKEKRMGSD